MFVSSIIIIFKMLQCLHVTNADQLLKIAVCCAKQDEILNRRLLVICNVGFKLPESIVKNY
jgi:hypothetical protein